MKGKESNYDELVDAIRDLTRVVLATSGQFTSKSEIIRKLNDLSMPPSRIARLLNMQLKDVTSAIYKAKKSGKKVDALRQDAAPNDVNLIPSEEKVPS